jgi:hypothetical protein
MNLEGKNNKIMKILVAGAVGFIAGYLVKEEIGL